MNNEELLLKVLDIATKSDENVCRCWETISPEDKLKVVKDMLEKGEYKSFLSNPELILAVFKDKALFHLEQILERKDILEYFKKALKEE